jgi:hypothetical protein
LEPDEEKPQLKWRPLLPSPVKKSLFVTLKTQT